MYALKVDGGFPQVSVLVHDLLGHCGDVERLGSDVQRIGLQVGEMNQEGLDEVVVVQYALGIG